MFYCAVWLRLAPCETQDFASLLWQDAILLVLSLWVIIMAWAGRDARFCVSQAMMYLFISCFIALSFLWDARFCVSTLAGCVILWVFTMSLLWGADGMYVGMKGYGMGMSWCLDIISAVVACALVTRCAAYGVMRWRQCINMHGCGTVYAILYMVTRNRECFYVRQWLWIQIRDFCALYLMCCVTVVYVVWCVRMIPSVLQNMPFDVAGKAFRHVRKGFPEHW